MLSHFSLVPLLVTPGLPLPGSSVRGILQARMLEWVAICFSRGSSQPRDHTGISCLAVGFRNEVLVENWLTSSVKDRESALILRRYVVHGTFFALLC